MNFLLLLAASLAIVSADYGNHHVGHPTNIHGTHHTTYSKLTSANTEDDTYPNVQYHHQTGQVYHGQYDQYKKHPGHHTVHNTHETHTPYTHNQYNQYKTYPGYQSTHGVPHSVYNHNQDQMSKLQHGQTYDHHTQQYPTHGAQGIHKQHHQYQKYQEGNADVVPETHPTSYFPHFVGATGVTTHQTEKYQQRHQQYKRGIYTPIVHHTSYTHHTIPEVTISVHHDNHHGHYGVY